MMKNISVINIPASVCGKILSHKDMSLLIISIQMLLFEIICFQAE